MFTKVNGEYILYSHSNCDTRYNFCEVITGKRGGFEAMLVLCKFFYKSKKEIVNK